MIDKGTRRFNLLFSTIATALVMTPAYAQITTESIILSPQTQRAAPPLTHEVGFDDGGVGDGELDDIVTSAGNVTRAGNGAPPLPPQATPKQDLSFEQAYQLLLARSDKLKAADMSVQSAQLRRDAVERLGGPSVSVTGLGYAFSAHVDVNLDPAKNTLNNVLGQLPPQIGGAISQLPTLPNHYSFKQNDQNASLGLSAVWPIYVGGFADAVRGEMTAMTDETRAQAELDGQSLSTLLVDRYFNAQLALLAAKLYEQALMAVQDHDMAAQKMLENGVISNIERLEAKAALAHAQELAKQTRDTAMLANTALSRTVQADGPISPTSDLFLSSVPLPHFGYFVELAYAHHPVIRQIESKKEQAGFIHDAQDALRKPQILAFANHDVSTLSHGKSNWVAGLAVRWSLWSDIDKQALMSSSLRQMAQADFTLAQALNDLALLVEQNWLNVTHARERFEAQGADETLAYEILKLRKVGLREGTSTPLDLIDAELNLARIKTERAISANEYVQSLAALLQSAGAPQEFGRFMQQANIHISKELL